jgi:hypothetical protein
VAHHQDPEVAIDRLIRTHTRLVTATGFATCLGGFFTLPVTIPTDVTAFYTLSTRCVAAVAHLRGYDTTSDEVRSVVLLTLLGAGGVGVGLPSLHEGGHDGAGQSHEVGACRRRCRRSRGERRGHAYCEQVREAELPPALIHGCRGRSGRPLRSRHRARQRDRCRARSVRVDQIRSQTSSRIVRTITPAQPRPIATRPVPSEGSHGSPENTVKTTQPTTLRTTG